MLRKHNGGRHVLLDLADEMEAGAGQELLPPVHRAHLRLHGVSGGVLGLYQTIRLCNALQGGDNLDGERRKRVIITNILY